IPNELSQLAQEIGTLALSDEDVLIYAMFPEIGKQFLESRKNDSLIAEPLISPASTNNPSALSEFDITLHGENYHIKVAGFGTAEQNQQSCFLWVDGVPEEVIIYRDEMDHPIANTSKKHHTGPGDITVAIPGTIITVQVAVGDEVKTGQTLLVLEAMKMETEIQAPHDGKVMEIFCQKGDKVTPEQRLMFLELKK
ncbi:MAG: pyruvate carboxylase subunit B, partial [Legionella sp.]